MFLIMQEAASDLLRRNVIGELAGLKVAMKLCTSHTLYPSFFVSPFSLSYSWTDTCPLTKNVLCLGKSKF